MTHITDLFNSLLEQSGSIDMAESDFKRMLIDDDDLRRQYRDWCDERGTTERYGFEEYCREYIERREGGWDVFNSDY